MTEIDKLMKISVDGTSQEQFYPETHAQAVQGLSEYIAANGGTGNTGATGATGQRGSQWFTGTSVTGTSTTPTVFSGSGVGSALSGDMYLNTSTSNVYQCTVGGAATTALWTYLESIKGSTGATGPQGPSGSSPTAVATSTANGLMSNTDKVKLDGLTQISLVKVKDV